MELKIKPCRDCLYYDDCIREAEYEYPDNPPKLKDRIYNIFVEGWDCFYGINRDLE
jgi:hypothetical protein